MAAKEIERSEYYVNLAISLSLRAFASERLLTFVKNGEIGVSSRDEIPSTVQILHKNLGMRKLTTKWMPRLLTIDQKCQRVRG